ncbi:MAG TPA: arsenite efflux transporter metallochaperone ArsD [Clostridia bacterium]|nr:arsenite efflux transporter metallochaperone ArsD [Clostridia bacterium]
MKKMIIFEPAMCCSTGVCGPSVDPELLRISGVINNLKNKGIIIERHNLSGNPQIFIENKEINRILNEEGAEALPVTMVDGIVVKKKAYPTDQEFCKLMGLPEDFLRATVRRASGGCCCKSGRC